MKKVMKKNVFVIDGISQKIVKSFHSENPKNDAESEANGFFNKSEGIIIHKPIPTKKYPNRFGIETPTDFFIHYFI